MKCRTCSNGFTMFDDLEVCSECRPGFNVAKKQSAVAKDLARYLEPVEVEEDSIDLWYPSSPLAKYLRQFNE